MAIVTVPLKSFPKRFGKFINSLGRGKSFFEKLAKPLIQNVVSEHFRDQGPGWAEWSDAWAAERARSGKGDGILVWNDFLRQSVVSSTGKKHVEKITSHEMQYGTNLLYSAVQQYGANPDMSLKGGIEDWVPFASRSTYGPGIPPRPFLYLTESNVEELNEYYLEWIMDLAYDALSGGGV